MQPQTEWIQAALDWFGWWVLAPLFFLILLLGMLWILTILVDLFLEWLEERRHTRDYNRSQR